MAQLLQIRPQVEEPQVAARARKRRSAEQALQGRPQLRCLTGLEPCRVGPHAVEAGRCRSRDHVGERLAGELR